MIAPRPTPVRVTAAGAVALPRWVFFALLAAFILPGLAGREPWLEDAGGFGIAWTMAHGTRADWWLPNVAGAWVAEEGPLAFWLAAASIRLLGPLLGDPLASRLVCVAGFAIAVASLWYATLRLARVDAAQPLSLVFGGEAQPRDYGRLMADIAALLLVATLGLVTRLHEVTAETVALPAACLALYGLALSIERPLVGAWVAGLSLGALALARGPGLAAGLLLGCMAAWSWQLARRRRHPSGTLRVERAPDAIEPQRWGRAEAPPTTLPLLIAPLVCVAVFAAWPVGASLAAPPAAEALWFDTWWRWMRDSIGPLGLSDLSWIGRNASWQLWPLWPLAAWGLYAWRHDLGTPHVALPALAAAGVVAVVALSSPLNDAVLIPLMPPLAVLGAYGASTLRRAVENVVDWFALAVFSLALVYVWGYWTAVMTGVPPAMARSVTRLAPGFAWTVQPGAAAMAAGATAIWLGLAWWRIAARPAPLWRGPLLSAAGLTATWVVAVSLAWPAVDYNRSHSALAREALRQLVSHGGTGACVQAHRIPPPYRALIAYFGPVRFGRDDSPESCPFALHRDTARSPLDDDPPPGADGTWRLVWEGVRAGRPDERWMLWARTRL